MTRPLVTIAIPVHKRLHYLPGALRSVAAQGYGNIELIVSDNGLNGAEVRNIVNAHYGRPWRFRQNLAIEMQVPHWNRLLAEATGEYFVLLADDDELSPTYVSELAGLLDRHSQAAVAIAAQQILDERGAVVRRTRGALPEVLPGGEFIRRAFHTYEWGFVCFMTIFGRTDEMRRCGGYPNFPEAQHGDDALLFKLSLGRPVVMSDRCAFRHRVYEASYGRSQDIRILAAATRQLLSFLNSDPQLREFASTCPAQWRELRGYLEQNKLETYYVRWRHMYRRRLTRLQWVRAAFALPYSHFYYRRVLGALLDVACDAVTERVKRRSRSPGSSNRE